METPLYEQIYDIVRQIPAGQVATYGQIAKMVERCTARMVGYAMAAAPWEADIPWQRVINAQGKISPRRGGQGHILQRTLLESEGVRFDKQARIDFNEYRWCGLEDE